MELINKVVVTICLIITTTIAILTYINNSKIQRLELKIKRLEYNNLKRKSKNNK